MVRKKLGKSGKLYTLADIQLNVIANNQAVRRAQQETQAKSEEARRRFNADYTRRLGSSFASGAPTADLLSVIAVELLTAQREEIDRKWGLRGAGLTNRTGAASTRPISGAGLTNRTGAAATRSVAKPATRGNTAASDAQLLAPVNTAAAAKGLRTGGVSVTKAQTGESAASRAARASMAQTRALPALKQGLKNAVSNAGRLATQLRLNLSSFPSVLRVASRALPARTSVLPRTPSRTSVGLPLTSLNPTLLGSQVAQAKCDCPKPQEPKRKKDSAERCTNPIISRRESGGIITTKRKLQCQPSKRK
jgi:hypothetical protein